MRTTVSKISLALVATAAAWLGTGCHSSIDPKLVYGTYAVSVSAFGKTDTDTVIATQGMDGSMILDFTYGIETDYNAANSTGLRVTFSGDNIELASQPIRITHSSGYVIGTVTGQGPVDGTKLGLTLDVVPSNLSLLGSDGKPLPPGSTVEYVVAGTRQ